MPPRYPPRRVALPCVGPGQSVGLYGGSFDPIHDGHLLVAERAFAALQLDWVWWLVTPGNPLKAHEPSNDLAARMEAVRQQGRHPRRKVLGIEEPLGVRYSADTVAYLRAMRPDVRFVWVMGADNVASFHRWNAWRTIAEQVPIAVIDRPGSRHASLSSPFAQTYRDRRLDSADAALLSRTRAPAWSFVRGPLSPLSSSALRAQRTVPS
ncbi:MAG: nicotinate-nucleotide adenylyltransferase [Devosiaceae bacterium]|nr:nicotinate-nucleotide adenylyltransferase [Devosiaceae bacterium MH13]